MKAMANGGRRRRAGPSRGRRGWVSPVALLATLARRLHVPRTASGRSGDRRPRSPATARGDAGRSRDPAELSAATTRTPGRRPRPAQARVGGPTRPTRRPPPDRADDDLAATRPSRADRPARADAPGRAPRRRDVSDRPDRPRCGWPRSRTRASPRPAPAIGEALAPAAGARALLLPTLNVGTNYHGHTGNLQRSSGRILSLSEQSLYVGGGARTLAAETVGIPAVQIFSPADRRHLRAAGGPAAGRRLADSTPRPPPTTILLEVADLLPGTRSGPRPAWRPLRQTVAEAAEVARLTAAYAGVGQAQKSDADRAAHRAEAPPGARSSTPRRTSPSPRPGWPAALHLDPVGPHPARWAARSSRSPWSTPTRRPRGPDPDGACAPARDGGPRAPRSPRPRPGSGRSTPARSCRPSRLGFSGGGFGGGSNLVPPLRRPVRRADRLRRRRLLDAPELRPRATWPSRSGRRAAVGEAEAERARVVNRVRREVMEASPCRLARRQQVEVGPPRAGDRRGRLPRGPDAEPGGGRPADRGRQQPEPAGQRPPEPHPRGRRLRPGPIPTLRRDGLAPAAGPLGEFPATSRTDRLSLAPPPRG